MTPTDGYRRVLLTISTDTFAPRSDLPDLKGSEDELRRVRRAFGDLGYEQRATATIRNARAGDVRDRAFQIL